MEPGKGAERHSVSMFQLSSNLADLPKGTKRMTL